MTVVTEDWVDWRHRANCKGDPGGIYADAVDRVGTAEELHYPTVAHKAICGPCPVQAECLDEALLMKEEGVWGNTTDYQRRQLGRPRGRERCPRCDGSSIVPENGHELCLACGVSWEAV